MAQYSNRVDFLARSQCTKKLQNKRNQTQDNDSLFFKKNTIYKRLQIALYKIDIAIS